MIIKKRLKIIYKYVKIVKKIKGWGNEKNRL